MFTCDDVNVYDDDVNDGVNDDSVHALHLLIVSLTLSPLYTQYTFEFFFEGEAFL